MALVHAEKRVYVKHCARALGHGAIDRFIDPVHEESTISFCWHTYGWFHIYSVPLECGSFELWFAMSVMKRLADQKDAIDLIYQKLGKGDREGVRTILLAVDQPALAAQVDELL